MYAEFGVFTILQGRISHEVGGFVHGLLSFDEDNKLLLKLNMLSAESQD